MILTEVEARKKECQLRFNAALSLATLEGMMMEPPKKMGEQRLELIEKIGRCVASDCMAWRWMKSNTVMQGQGGPVEYKTGRGDKGYCGLAGRPE